MELAETKAELKRLQGESDGKDRKLATVERARDRALTERDRIHSFLTFCVAQQRQAGATQARSLLNRIILKLFLNNSTFGT